MQPHKQDGFSVCLFFAFVFGFLLFCFVFFALIDLSQSRTGGNAINKTNKRNKLRICYISCFFILTFLFLLILLDCFVIKVVHNLENCHESQYLSIKPVDPNTEWDTIAFFISSTCIATLLHCKLKHIVARLSRLWPTCLAAKNGVAILKNSTALVNRL